MSELAAVEESAGLAGGEWPPGRHLDVHPRLLEELAVGWLHGEGYIDRIDEVHLRPCATDLGFWAEIPPERVAAVLAEGRRPVLASGCGAVSTFLAEPSYGRGQARSGRCRPARAAPGSLQGALRPRRALQGHRRDPRRGAVDSAAAPQPALIAHAEDIGRHNAVDKSIGGALLAGRRVDGSGASGHRPDLGGAGLQGRAGGAGWVATPSVPSTLAVEIARRSGMVLVGRAVSGTPQLHGAAGPETHGSPILGELMRMRDSPRSQPPACGSTQSGGRTAHGRSGATHFYHLGSLHPRRGLWTVPTSRSYRLDDWTAT